jgi:hypothetical protein
MGRVERKDQQSSEEAHMIRKFFAIPGTALAEFNTGDMELSLSGSGSSDNDFDATTASVEASLGYFLTPTLEAVIRQGIGFSDTPEDSDWNASTRLGIDYNFPFTQFVPYIGASLGYLYGDSVEEQFIAGPEVGLKSFVNDTTFILAAVEYQFLFDDKDDADEAFNDGRFVYTLGIGFKW